MWEQARILKNIANAAPLGGHGELDTVQADAAGIGLEQTGDDVHERRLAAARAAKKRDDAGGGCFKSRAQREVAALFGYIDAQHSAAQHFAHAAREDFSQQ